MTSVLEVIRKSAEYIELAWRPEDGANPTVYRVYVSNVPSPTSMSQLAEVPNILMNDSHSDALNKLYYRANIEDVRTLLGLSSTLDFSNLLLYFTITYVEGGVESSILLSTVVTIPPVGINPTLGRDDPTQMRQPYVFSDELQRWHKQAGSARGALIIDEAIYYKTNEVQAFTYDSTGNVMTIKAYLTDATLAGSYAKLVSYEYSSGLVSKITVSDSTV